MHYIIDWHTLSLASNSCAQSFSNFMTMPEKYSSQMGQSKLQINPQTGESFVHHQSWAKKPKASQATAEAVPCWLVVCLPAWLSLCVCLSVCLTHSNVIHMLSAAGNSILQHPLKAKCRRNFYVTRCCCVDEFVASVDSFTLRCLFHWHTGGTRCASSL